MYTLLPEKQIKGLEKEYHIRLIILGIFFLSGAVWIGIISLFPSYIFSVVQEKNAENQVLSLQKNSKLPAIADTTKEISDANSAIARVRDGQDAITFSVIVEDIASRRTQGISITNIEIAHARTDSVPNQTNIAITGHANTRDQLVAFRQSLEADTALTNINLPISDLAYSKDINFSMSLTGVH
jgi:hypothetical protein